MALFALTLFALSNRLIYYSSEVKQYSSDVLITLSLYLLAISIQKTDLSPSRIFQFGSLGAIAIWFSHPSIFILASIGTVLFLYEKNNMRVRQLTLICFFWIISFTLFYFFSLRDLSSNDGLLNYWSHTFMPTSTLFGALDWIKVSFILFFENPMQLVPLWFSIPLFLWGAVSIFKQDTKSFLMLSLSTVFVLIASALHTYPFGGRLLLFLIPIFLLFIAQGLYQMIVALHLYKLIEILVVAILLINPIIMSAGHIIYPRKREEVKPVLQYIKRHRKRSDEIYVYYGAARAFQYYSGDYNLDTETYTVGIESRTNWNNYIEDLNKLRDQRVWVLFSHVCDWVQGDEEIFFIESLDRRGTRLKQIESPGASAYLYEFAQ